MKSGAETTAGVSVSTTAGRGSKSPYIKHLLGWCGMILREGCIELAGQCCHWATKLHLAVNWFDSFECVDKAVKKYRGIS